MTAVTIQTDKIVFSEVKNNQALLEPSYGKKQTDLLVNPIHTLDLLFFIVPYKFQCHEHPFPAKVMKSVTLHLEEQYHVVIHRGLVSLMSTISTGSEENELTTNLLNHNLN